MNTAVANETDKKLRKTPRKLDKISPIKDTILIGMRAILLSAIVLIPIFYHFYSEDKEFKRAFMDRWFSQQELPNQKSKPN